MRVLIAIITTLMLGLFSTNTDAQTVTWPFGPANMNTDEVKVTQDTTLVINNRMVYSDYLFDGNRKIDIGTINARPGSFLMLELSDDGGANTVTFGTNIVSQDKTLSAGATHVACFINKGDKYVLCGYQRIK